MTAREGLKYIWIETCCIDKASSTSSAELSEAIYSMFRYYREALVCYAYLSDTTSVTVANTSGQCTLEASDFYGSVWFKRGWTLQELIASKNLRFITRTRIIWEAKMTSKTASQLSQNTGEGPAWET
jgi:hypothetical protein